MVFDIAALIFIGLFSYIMMKKGGVKAILSLCSLALAIIIGSMAYPALTAAVYNTSIPDGVEEKVREVLVEKGQEIGKEAIDELPAFVGNSIDFDFEENGTAQKALDNVASEITRVIINVIVFLIVVIVVKIGLSVLIGALDLTTKLPVIHQLNSVVGLCCGVVMSLVIVWGLVAAVGVIGASNPSVAGWVDGSVTVGIMSNIAPF